MIYNNEEFIEFVKEHYYPFKSSFYKTKIGATSELDLAFTSPESDFEYFLQFLKQEYGISFGGLDPNEEQLGETNNLAGTLSQSFLNQSH